MNTIIQVHGLTKNYAASQTLAIFPIPLQHVLLQIERIIHDNPYFMV